MDAFSKVGLPAEAAAYGALLAIDGYEEMRDLAYAELLNKAALVELGILGGHAGRLLSVYGDLNPKNAAAKQTVYVQFREGLCSVHPAGVAFRYAHSRSIELWHASREALLYRLKEYASAETLQLVL